MWLKSFYYLKQPANSMQFLSKSQRYLCRTKKILQFIRNLKGPQVAKIILENNTVGSFIFPDFKTSYRTMLIKQMQCRHRNRPPGQWNRIKSPEINTRVNTVKWAAKMHHHRTGQNSLFNKRDGNTGYPHTHTKMKLDPCRTP